MYIVHIIHYSLRIQKAPSHQIWLANSVFNVKNHFNLSKNDYFAHFDISSSYIIILFLIRPCCAPDMANETSCFPKKIISPELFWSESQKSWISSETKNTVAKIKEDKSETEIQQKNSLLCRYCYVYRVLRLTLEILKHTQMVLC